MTAEVLRACAALGDDELLASVWTLLLKDSYPLDRQMPPDVIQVRCSQSYQCCHITGVMLVASAVLSSETHTHTLQHATLQALELPS
jgi:hypothetical protein